MHRVRVSAFSIDAHPVTNEQFTAFVRDTGYTTVAERPVDPADYPGRAAREPPARVDGVHPHRRPRRPASPEPVVDLDARRMLEGAGGARAARSSGAPTTRWCTWRTRTRRRTPPGRTPPCPPRPSGSTPPAAASRAPPSPGATRPGPADGSWPTPGTGPTSPGGAPGRAAGSARRRWAASRRTGTGCSTWPATCGSGPTTGGPAGTRTTPAAPAARRRTPRRRPRVQLRPRPAAVPDRPQGRSRAARTCAPTPTACATAPRPAGRRWWTPG